MSQISEASRQKALELSKTDDKTGYMSTLTVNEALDKLASSPKGLSSQEAQRRLAIIGGNELDKEPLPTAWEIFLEQFADPLVIMLLVSAVVAGALNEFQACIVIMTIVIFNAILGVKMELGANNALEVLANSNPPMTLVRRDNERLEIPTREVVPGDIVLVETGAKIPADLRIIDSHSLYVDEASLNGESEPAKKLHDHVVDAASLEAKGKDVDEDESLLPQNMLYMGTMCRDGNALGVVTSTGMRTRMGPSAALLADADEGQSPLQIKLEVLGGQLGSASLGVSVIVFIVGIIRAYITAGTAKAFEGGVPPCPPWNGWCPDPNDPNNIRLQMLLIAVSLTVAAVPEGLPVCITICNTNGMSIMANKFKAQITALKNVETLGSASVICTDKTGTLTCGIMTIVNMWFSGRRYQVTGVGYDPSGEIVPESEATNDSNANAKLSHSGPHRLPLLFGALNSPGVALKYNAETKQHEAHGHMTERPVVVASRKAGYSAALLKKYPIIAENSFDSTRKCMSTLHEVAKDSPDRHFLPANTSHIIAVKGASDVLLSLCTHILDAAESHGDEPVQARKLTKADKDGLLEQIDNYARRAYRVLAVAYRPLTAKPADVSAQGLEKDLVFVGLVASIDPERPEVKPVIAESHHAGIRVVMITGDYVLTAKSIAENIGILDPESSNEDSAIDCAKLRHYGERARELESQLKDDAQNDNAKRQLDETQKKIDEIVAAADVYARARPADKITIVKSLQRMGNVCSMTGDGVNDAPALKQANIGVAMGLVGTDAAKAAADMVLLDDNFVSIYHAIKQGRTIYADIQKFVYFLLSTNTAEVFLLLFAVLLGLPTPLTPIQILYLNLTTDGAPAVALAVEFGEAGLMDEGPRPLKEPLLEKMIMLGTFIQTIVLTILVLGTYMLGLFWHTGSAYGAFPDNPTPEQFNAHNDGVLMAQTMSIQLIVYAELLRAYSSRSLRESVFSMGFWSNVWMQYAVGASVIATLVISFVPFFQGFFGCCYLDARSYLVVAVGSLIPFAVDELTKYVYRLTGFGRRPKVNRYRHHEVESKKVR